MSGRGRARPAGANALLGLAAGATLLLGAAPAPDLCVPRDGLRRDGARVRAVVENRGTAPAPATTLELRDRSPLGGPTGGSSLYPFTPNRAGVWIFQEPDGRGAVALEIALGAGLDGAAPPGRVRFFGASDVAREGTAEGVRRVDGDTVAWDAPSPGGRRVRLRVTPAGARPPEAVLFLDFEAGAPLPIVHGPDGERVGSQVRVTLDALAREAARVASIDVPPLAPGQRRELVATFPAGVPDEVFARVDPHGEIAEIREGNNVACWRPDRDRVTLAALHLHSSFSEGAGSVDWQVLHAAASGYDLAWWSEHEWRIGCRDHVTAIDFSPDDAVEVDPSGTSEGATVEPLFAAGEDGHALRLDVSGAGEAVASLAEPRKRTTFSLAADVSIELRVLARRLDADDRFTVVAELSQHPGEKRRIAWVFRWEGLEADGRDAGDAVRAAVARTIPTGSWVTVELPLSRDAERLWPNGLDSNLQGLRLALESGGSGASVLVDGLRFRHGSCGERLRSIQESWMVDYPNVRHLFADEVSFARPHLNQYGGPRSLFDGEAIWNEERVADMAERARSAGGLLSWCHPLGVRPSRRVQEMFGPTYRDSLVASRFAGTSALEVGFRRKGAGPLEDYLALWDDASRRGTAITGIGVNDSHERDWGSWENNFGTWLAAPADDATRLLDALRRGRAVFGDPLRFRGRLTMSCGAAVPGDVLVGSAPREVVVRLSGGPEDARVTLVADGAPSRTWPAPRGAGTWSARFAPGEARFVRAEVRSAAGEPLAFTNPIWFDPDGHVRRP